MQLNPLERGSRLFGCSILLSAGIPRAADNEQFPRVRDAARNIETAVIAIARAVFVQAGSLVFSAHPSLSPLVAAVLREYVRPAPAEQTFDARRNDDAPREPSIAIYETEHLERDREQALLAHSRGLPTVRIQPMDANETNVEMRRTMVQETRPIAMVAIGGAQSVLDEATIFGVMNSSLPIFAFSDTGGAARRLAGQSGLNVRDEPSQLNESIDAFWQREEMTDLARLRNANEANVRYKPYDVFAQLIVSQLLESRGGLQAR